MKPLTLEWVAKAEGDHATAVRESRARRNRNPDAIGFHSQQCVEKYLKARLCEAGLEIPRTHDLPALLMIAAQVEPLWTVHQEWMAELAAYATAFRYPGEPADEATARRALAMTKKFRKEARRTLGLPLN